MVVIRIDPSSEDYRQFARLYELARQQYPSETDRWNRELYVSVGEGNWGSLQRDGSFKLSKELVLDNLRPDAPPQQQVQALTTVLHETMHARVEIDGPDEPNAVPSRHSKALDEGLTEWVAVDGVAVFADGAGYGQLPEAEPEYSAAFDATNSLLTYAAGLRQAQLALRAIDEPVVMRWDVIADEIVKNRLGSVVPEGSSHQQAARAELISAMIQPGWFDLHQTNANVGQAIAQQMRQALDDATDRIREHYVQGRSTPYPSKNPNFRVRHQRAELNGSQDRNSVQRGGMSEPTGRVWSDYAARPPTLGRRAADVRAAGARLRGLRWG